jgi:hypothetical protein
MVTRFPHPATITWKDDPVKNDATGDYTEGLPHSIPINGRIEPAAASQRINLDGRVINVGYKFFTTILLQSIPVNASINVLGQTRKILQIFNFQTHCEIWL